MLRAKIAVLKLQFRGKKVELTIKFGNKNTFIISNQTFFMNNVEIKTSSLHKLYNLKIINNLKSN